MRKSKRLLEAKAKEEAAAALLQLQRNVNGSEVASPPLNDSSFSPMMSSSPISNQKGFQYSKKSQSKKYEQPKPKAAPPHPLLNTLILSTIFKMLPLADLRNCRLVCTLWNAESIRFWRTITAISIRNNGGNIFSSTSGETDVALRRFRRFADSVNLTNSGPVFCSQFTLTRLFHRYLNQKEVLMFWDGCGSWMTTLKLDRVKMSRRVLKIFQEALFDLTPNLQELVLRHCTVDKTDVKSVDPKPVMGEEPQVNLKSLEVHWYENDYLPFDWQAMFEHFVNLNSLEFTIDCARQLEHPLTAMKNIQERSDFTRTFKVNSLTLHHGPRFRIEQLGTTSVIPIQQLLQLTRLPLQYFAVDLDIFRWMPDFIFGEILEPFSETLRTLRVKRLRRSDNFLTVPMTALENVKFSILELNSHLIIHPVRYPISVKCLQYTPKLCSLEVEDYDLQKWGPTVLISTEMQPEMATVLPNQSVSKLVYKVKKTFTTSENLNTPCPQFILQTIQNFTRLMPNVTVLEFPLDNEGFSVVCRHWPALKELTILKHWFVPWGVDDAGITGLTCMGRDFWMGERLPNITNLKELTTFRMNFCNLLSHGSVHFGFAQLPKLNRLEVQLVTGQLGDGLQRLIDRVPNVIIRYVDNETIQSVSRK